MSITQIQPIPHLNIGGEIKALNLNLNQDNNIETILNAGKNDEHDQVYLHDMESNQSYVIEGERLDFSKQLQLGKIPVAIVTIDGKETRVRVKAVNNEDTLGQSSVYKYGALGAVGGLLTGAVMGGKIIDMGIPNTKVAGIAMIVGIVGIGVAGAVGAVKGTQHVLNKQAQTPSGLSQYYK